MGVSRLCRVWQGKDADIREWWKPRFFGWSHSQKGYLHEWGEPRFFWNGRFDRQKNRDYDEKKKVAAFHPFSRFSHIKAILDFFKIPTLFPRLFSFERRTLPTIHIFCQIWCIRCARELKKSDQRNELDQAIFFNDNQQAWIEKSISHAIVSWQRCNSSFDFFVGKGRW